MATYITTFSVAGGPRFPVDMLRYDRCYPLTGDDAALLADALNPEVSARDRAHKPIRLAHIGNNRHWGPTIGRWSSFLWGVDPETIETHSF